VIGLITPLKTDGTVDVSVVGRCVLIEMCAATLQGPGAYDTHTMDITVVKGTSARKSSFGGPFAAAQRSSVLASFAPVSFQFLAVFVPSVAYVL
jgi:hypothetical protein